MKKRLIKVFMTVGLLFIAIHMLYLIISNNIPEGNEIENKINNFPSYVTYEISSEKYLEQTFIPQYGHLSDLNLVLLHVGDGYTGILHMEIQDSQNVVIWQGEKEISDIDPGERKELKVNVNVQKNELYKLKLYTEQEQEPVWVMVINSAFDTKENQSCYYQGQEIPGGLSETFEYMTTYSNIGKTLSCITVIIVGMFLMGVILIDDFKSKLMNILFDEQDLKKRYYYIGLGIVTLIMVYAHLYKLSEVPYGINVDEMGMGYDAFSMANFGVDRHLKSFPAYLINFCNGQSSLYMYLAAIAIKLFGYSEVVLRYPAVLNAVLIVVFGAKICKEKWNKRSTTLVYTMLYSVFPVFIMFTRVGLDCNLMLGFSTVFLYLLIKAVDQQKYVLFMLAGLFGGITLYGYAISYLVLPVFLVIILGYLLWMKKITFKQIVSFAIPLGIVALPLILVQFVNMFDWPEFKLGFITITKLPIYRDDELSMAHYVRNVYQTIVNILFQDNWHYDTLPKYKTMYWFSVPFIVIGVIKAISDLKSKIVKKEYDITTFMLVWLSTILLAGGLLDGGSGVTSYKVNAAFFATTYFCVGGMVALYEKVKNEKWIYGAIGALIVAYMVSFISFTEYYYNQYNEDTYPSYFFNTTYKGAIQAYENLDDSLKNRDVWVEKAGDFGAIYFYGSILKSPYELQYDNIAGQYEQYIFKEADELTVDTSIIYILQESSEDFAKELEKNGFMVSLVDTRFLCYYPN